MKKALLIGTLFAVTMLTTQQAQAQCGSGFGISICGQVYVNTPVVTPPPVVVRTPRVHVTTVPVYTPPPVVYTPPPVVYTPPPAPVIVQQPAPVVVTQQYVTTTPRPVLHMPRREFVRHRGFGFGARAGAGYAATEEITNFGGGAVARFIASPRFGIEITGDVYGGAGYTGDVERVEIPVTVNALWFVNPRHRVQLYLLGGLGVSFAAIEAANGDEDTPVYGGGELGVGVEFLLGNHIGLTLDVRGFLRGRMNERELPESSPAYDGSCREADGGGYECTDLEGGVTFNAGFNFYL